MVVPLLVLFSGGLLMAVFWQSGWQAVFSAQPPAAPYGRADAADAGDRAECCDLPFVVRARWQYHALWSQRTRSRCGERGSDWCRFRCWPALAGLASSLVLGSSDPVQWTTPLVGPVIGLAMLLVLVFANLSSLTGMLQGNVPTIVQNFGRFARAFSFAGKCRDAGHCGGADPAACER